jgi:hypothetical protein
MNIEEKIDKYLNDELDEDYEESELQKLGYKKTGTVGGGMSGKRKAGSVYTHPTTGKKKVVMKKSIADRVKHAAGQIKKKITEDMDEEQ